jgi:hypothetical protein
MIIILTLTMMQRFPNLQTGQSLHQHPDDFITVNDDQLYQKESHRMAQSPGNDTKHRALKSTEVSAENLLMCVATIPAR